MNDVAFFRRRRECFLRIIDVFDVLRGLQWKKSDIHLKPWTEVWGAAAFSANEALNLSKAVLYRHATTRQGI